MWKNVTAKVEVSDVFENNDTLNVSVIITILIGALSILNFYILHSFINLSNLYT